MNPNAIVYTSNTGYTRQYATLLGEKTGLPVYSLEEAASRLPCGNCVIYLGWLMAGKVQGYAKAAKRYQIAAVCGVGMGSWLHIGVGRGSATVIMASGVLLSVIALGIYPIKAVRELEFTERSTT